MEKEEREMQGERKTIVLLISYFLYRYALISIAPIDSLVLLTQLTAILTRMCQPSSDQQMLHS